VGKAGDPLPPFRNHMIRQRVDRHGNIYQLEPASRLPGCNLPASEIGVIKEGPVRKWMAAKKKWDTKYASTKRQVQKQRAKEMAKGYQTFGDGEVPPPSALAGRRKTGADLKEEKKKRSTGMSLWSLWGSKHDEKTIDKEKEADKEPATTVASGMDGAGARPLHDTKTNRGKKMESGKKPEYSRSRSRRQTVTDEHQTEYSSDVVENTPEAALVALMKEKLGETGARDDRLSPDFVAKDANPTILVRTSTVDESELKRPKAGGIAFPFSLKQEGANASMITLTSAVGVSPTEDARIDGVMESGVKENAADIEASNATGNSSEEAKTTWENGKALEGAAAGAKKEKDGEAKAVENGEVVSAAWPPLETSVSAMEDLLPPPGH
jgi:hypothetical protein